LRIEKNENGTHDFDQMHFIIEKLYNFKVYLISDAIGYLIYYAN